MSTTAERMKGLVAAAAAALNETSCDSNQKSAGNLPMRKRKSCVVEPCLYINDQHTGNVDIMMAGTTNPQKKARKETIFATKEVPKGRVRRLEQNRLAAIESRRRKKVMVEELQRSVKFYSKANATLRNQNDDLEQRILVARQKVQAIENGTETEKTRVTARPATALPVDSTIKAEPILTPPAKPTHVSATDRSQSSTVTSNSQSPAEVSSLEQQAQSAQFAATQALYESLGYPPAAARAAAGTFSQFVCLTGKVPGMPSSTAAPIVPKAPMPLPSPVHNPIAPPVLSLPTPVSSVVTHATPSPAISADIMSFNGNAQITSYNPLPRTEPCTAAKPAESIVGSNDQIPQSPHNVYIEALNQFAMQQAVAANAAAAAANAALQAAKWHNQMNVPTSTVNAGAPFFFFPGMTTPQLPFTPPVPTMPSVPAGVQKKIASSDGMKAIQNL